MITLINNYLKYLEIEKRYSSKTIDNYKIDLEFFLSFFKNDKAISDITYDDLRNYLQFLCEKNYSNKTISRHISSLKSFYKYLVNHNVIVNNPTELLSSPKASFRLPTYLNVEELDDLLNTPNRESKVGKRDILILEMFYATGVRLSELVNIKFSDIDFKNRMIKIKGKGSKDRYVFYSKECAGYLADYLKYSRNYFESNNKCEYLFLNQHGNKLSESGIEYIMNKILKESGINVHLTPHVLRHTFATHMLNEGADLMTVKELLGHSNISTTGIYTHVSNEQLRRAYLNAHPRAKKGE